MVEALIRDYQPGDREAVRTIAYETGLMGSSIRAQYRDFHSFADMFTSYYTDVEPQHSVVAELGGKVVGYILSSADSRKAWSPGRVALRHMITRGICFRPGTAAFWFRGMIDTIADLGKGGRPKFDLARYPSHTHNNLLPEGRGASIGTEFFFRVFDKLKLAGSPGMHGEALAENHAMVAFATERLGYKLVGEPYPIPGLRLRDGKRVYLRLALRDLSDWVPGAWMEQRRLRATGQKAS